MQLFKLASIMSTATFSPTIKPTKLFQNILGNFYSRRLLLHTSSQPPTIASPPLADAQEASHSYAHHMSFDTNVVKVLSVIFCALIFSLGLHSIIRVVMRYSNLLSTQASNELAVRLANTGVKGKALKSFQTLSYSTELKRSGLDTECAICLSEFVSGERVKLLPKCHHGFHVRCIDKWLSSHSSCPTCRHCLIQTCQKIAGCGEASSSRNQPPHDIISVHIAPVGPERLIHSF
ncbi:RING-H2 finger protein ATL78-like [Raphanus sativus]|uniref:RING-type E3 ubiquitin transferase n=1 Tax=Raphanus sativus TaxID=3726 RepID=A0A9W3CSF6_RAPSA|nr:RING-H2 finger protein ATL78-like [Raphanus sativus]XP_056854430.1 RING-H2 finger protein ATL78-like [Raphanus sativus]